MRYFFLGGGRGIICTAASLTLWFFLFAVVVVVGSRPWLLLCFFYFVAGARAVVASPFSPPPPPQKVRSFFLFFLVKVSLAFLFIWVLYLNPTGQHQWADRPSVARRLVMVDNFVVSRLCSSLVALRWYENRVWRKISYPLWTVCSSSIVTPQQEECSASPEQARRWKYLADRQLSENVPFGAGIVNCLARSDRALKIGLRGCAFLRHICTVSYCGRVADETEP